MELKQQNIVFTWFVWHFIEMPKFLLSVWKNYFWFGMNFFSIPVLLATLFSPWRKYQWRYPRGFDIGEFFSSLISNLFSRLIGAIIRIFLSVFGIVVQLVIFIVGLVAILLWILIPLILIILLLFLLTY